ncbi:hypothetical protein PL321_01055 [Caloramator sp. mosi_1]|nr:hypothetical protein [Caloramator sp. mosi_1]WDC84437.1 hypothetical protein PL321_01055 [Caloramator sp. mosi_1]
MYALETSLKPSLFNVSTITLLIISKETSSLPSAFISFSISFAMLCKSDSFNGSPISSEAACMLFIIFSMSKS